MKKIKVEPANRCLIWHRWELIEDTGKTSYHECKDCGARIAKQLDGGCYQPIDNDWVMGNKKEL